MHAQKLNEKPLYLAKHGQQKWFKISKNLPLEMWEKFVDIQTNFLCAIENVTGNKNVWSSTVLKDASLNVDKPKSALRNIDVIFIRTDETAKYSILMAFRKKMY